ncbi:phosphoacetylglucosamine mutase (macronuclear) [Tetrahymena thermophila SB210]|uniref:Phosphoacetylglucosamine mutase n=1 Tax=Tetrahymena thermophila (strain SB210) TaxID=312017 RepID=Q23DK4_TETTS|nr:phosphoacetylglucosamine mutase [Tetrahymena thermophila SB210]EAR94337.2 phosphoacetylglucosamine mutase [Tetrahymena thermophila SB210]|eukprot:XP_001014682.2 phosphoacetylglucosamine mutase [Tetrahymena thermophila SB210]
MTYHFTNEFHELDKNLYQEYLSKFYNKFHRHIAYGTAGFRDDAQYLEHVCLRIGVFMGLFAKVDNHKVLGIQVTASHNPIRDNGIKVSDFDGSMIRTELEKQLEVFVLDPNLDNAVAELVKVLTGIKGFDNKNQGMVFVGQDTRPSCPKLVHLIEQGLKSVGTLVRKTGEVTTPMLHHNVWFFNLFPHNLTRSSWTEQFTASYFNTYWTFFDEFMTELGFQKKNDEHILLDLSNGVGGVRIGPFREALQKYYNLDIINDTEHRLLNEQCGAEFVHKSQDYPIHSIEKIKSYPDISKVRVVSYDGDSDRIVYFLPRSDFKQIDLLDGDKMISLFALYFKKALEKLQTKVEAVNKTGILNVDLKPSEWVIGMVQTPYANGSSTIYLRDQLKLTTFFSPNGVKNLHPNAHKYDIGIYCESNGHGTFLVKEKKTAELEKFYHLRIEDFKGTPENLQVLKEFLHEVKQLYRFIRVQNQCVGDSITNMLCIEAALATLNMTGQDYLNLYTDLKCKNSKVTIRDKSKLKMSYAEDNVQEPKEIQEKINAIVAKHPGSRAFIRPSGTEDIVRIYAESADSAQVDAVTNEIKDMILADKTIN